VTVCGAPPENRRTVTLSNACTESSPDLCGRQDPEHSYCLMLPF